MPEDKRPNSLVFNEAILKGFINGTLDREVEAKVAGFLESRPELIEKVAAKSGDAFLKRLRQVLQPSAVEEVAEVEAVLVDSEPVDSEPVVPEPAVKAPAVKAPAVKEPVSKATSKESLIPDALASYPGYSVTKELGRGGMGVVYLAKNVQLDRLEVLKVLNERLLDHDGAKERFLREIRAVSKLNHTNIVTSYSILPLDNLMVFAMEYVHGSDLHKFIQKHKSLPVGLACNFTKQLAAGLQHAHEKGLVHRDIKPSNVIVYKSDGQLQLKILDFGLAKASSEEAAAGLTQDGTMLGTPEYMAPEQTLNAAKADIRADIYSLGCTLYCMLTGKPPFSGSHGAVLLAHSQQEPKLVSLIRSDIPMELAAVVSKMMAKDKLKRYQTPAEVSQALTPFLNQNRVGSSKQEVSSPAPNTLNDLKGPDRDTSVEEPAPVLSLDVASRMPEPQFDFLDALPSVAQHRPISRQVTIGKRKKRTKSHIPPWFIPTAIGIGALFSFFALWQFGVFSLKTPNGTIVVENMPEDAEVLVDGQKVEIAWNAGKDKAEVSIEPGSHQLKVMNQGNEILGRSVSVKGGDSTVVKLSVITPAPSNPSVATKPEVTPNRSLPKIADNPVQTLPIPTSPPPADSSDWRTLFNGIDLKGWKGDSRFWSVKNGCITGKLTAEDNLKFNTCLVWDGGSLGDFEIEYECKVSSDGNSGLHFRSKYFDANQFVLAGYQADCDGKGTFTGVLYDERGRGILANLGEQVVLNESGTKSTMPPKDTASLRSAIKAEEWNRYRVVAKGNVLEYYVNSQLACKVIDQDAGKASSTGLLGLQLHRGKPMEVQFKNLRLRLSPDEFSKTVISTPSGVAASQIPGDAVRFGNHAYKVFADEVTWEEANKRCVEMGGKLACPENALENAFLVKIVKASTISSIWIDVTDRDKDGVWGHSDGSKILYDNWDTPRKQPDNAQGVEYYAALFADQGGVWWDYPNDPTKYPGLMFNKSKPDYVCQWKLTSSEVMSDPFVAGSIWGDYNKRLVVQSRSGEDFIAKFTIGNTIERIVSGKIKDGKLGWYAKDVRAVKGKVGEDNFGPLVQDAEGYRIDFTWGELSPAVPTVRGNFVLRLQK